MKTFLYFAFIIAFSISAFSQNYFSIQTDFFGGFSDRTQKLIPISEGIITMNSHLCLDDSGNSLGDCGSYVLYDYSGNILVKKLLPFIDVQNHSIQYDHINHEVIIAGHNQPNSPKNNIYHLYKCNLNGDSLFHQTYEIEEAINKEVFVNGLHFYNNQYIIIGQGKYGEDTFEDARSTTMWINEDGTLDTTIIFDIYQFNSHQAVIDKNGHLTIMYSAFDSVIPSWKKRVGFKKFNEAKEVVWEWLSPFTFEDGRYPVFDITEDNAIAFVFQPDVNEFDDESAVGLLSEDGELLWQYEFVTGPYKRIRIDKLVVTENDDILGVGTMRDITEESPDGTLYDTGYAFRLSNTGELLWMRRFRDFNDLDLLKWGSLHAIAEAENGDLIMGGMQRENIWDNTAPKDAWLIITDENGCIEPDCDDLIILDNRELFFSKEEIQLVQNPVGNQLTVNVDLVISEVLNYQIFDAMGRDLNKGVLSQQHGLQAIEVANLPSGLFYLYVFSEEKRRTFKFIKN